MIRILHFFNKMTFGGAETLVMNLYRSIDREKVQFDFAVFSKDAGEYDEEIKNLGGNIHYIPNPKNEGILKYANALFNLLNKKNSFSVIHTHMLFFSGISIFIAKIAGVPIRISHSHTTKYGKNLTRKAMVLRKLFEWIMRMLINYFSTHRLACSIEAGIFLYGERKSNKIIILKNGIEVKKFLFDDNKRNLYRSKFKIENSKIVIGHVGRFDLPKNHLFLIDWFNELLLINKNYHLILIGEGKLKSEIEDKCVALGILHNVFFIGSQPNVNDLLSAFDIFVLPSLYEGLPLVCIEAQANGLNCLLSDVISKEVDLKLDLVTFLPINQGTNIWVSELSNLKHDRLLDDERIMELIISKEFDIGHSVKLMQNIYINGTI